MKAIDTQYKGYRFRSRLEARWAVFFDAMGANWNYELEGYELGNGKRYLPDFAIGRYLLEVKPDIASFELDKLFLASRETQKSIILLDGIPDFKFYDLLVDHTWIVFTDEYGSQTGESLIFPHRIGLWNYDSREDAVGNGRSFYDSLAGTESYWEDDPQGISKRYIAAVYAARSARFEFGETPC